jgi:hypothetical protein
MFTTPVAISANTTYVVSRTDPLGNFAVTPHGLDNAVTNGNLTALSGTTTGNGVFAFGATETYPNTTNTAHSNYGVDVMFNQAAPTPTPTATTAVTATPTNTVAPTNTATPVAPSEMAIAFGEGGTDFGGWTVTSGWTLDVNYNGNPGARPMAIAHKSATPHATTTGPTFTNAGSQSASGGSLVLIRGGNLGFKGATAGVHVSGVGGGTSATLATPSGAGVGNLYFVYIDTTTAQTVTPPSGWTLARTDGEGKVWYQNFGSVPTDLGVWSTTGSSGWDHVQVAFGAKAVVDAAGGGGAQTSSTISTGSATSP